MKMDVIGFFMGCNRLKKNQRDEFIEKKIKRPKKGGKSVSNQDEEKTITITILIAITILVGLLIYFVLTPSIQEPSSAIYLLDSQKQTENFPKTVVLGENNTLTIWVGVENHNGVTKTFSVQIKMDDRKGDVDPSPAETLESYEKTLADGDLWEFQVMINIDQVGSHRIIFELWSLDDYLGNWVSLSLEAI
jgi:uncharacterized membrane protein